jgi:hypothetical protein
MNGESRDRVRKGTHDDFLFVGILERLRSPYRVFALRADDSAPTEPRNIATHDYTVRGGLSVVSLEGSGT